MSDSASGSVPPPLDSERWAHIEDLFHRASELSGTEQSEFLDRECADDPPLRRSVERFLAADSGAGAVLDASLGELAVPLLLPDDEPEDHLPAGTAVGRYRLLDVLGSGGMGTVYRAERADGSYERQVALKMVKSGRLEGEAERRFQRERQILARLAHPGIATLLDGGLTEDGRPYLVMELVNGESITNYAATHSLGVEQRIRLALQVIDAVDYAHRNLVVHRDLKPSNILVAEGGTVKLLDFGIARLTGDEEEHGATRTGLLPMTPEYAAPEQIRGEAATTATDVYSIGAILYELLALRKPFGRVSGTWRDLERVLNQPPPSLSDATDLDRATRKQVDGDLDTIVRKALHKDQQRRYATARALGDDLTRYLDGHPVSARPDSVSYRLSRFVGRNRAASIATAALFAAVTVGGLGTFWQAREARLQAERGQAVGDFLFSLFDGVDPDVNPGGPATALELVEAGVARVDSLDAGPEAKVDLLTTLGALLGKLGQQDRSVELLQQAVAEARASLRPGDPAIGDALDALGVRLSTAGDLEESERLLTEALEVRQANGATTVDIASTMGSLGATLRDRGRYDEAEEMYDAAIGQLTSIATGDSLLFASELMGLGQVYQFQDRLDEAEHVFRTVRRLQEETGREEPILAFVIHNLAVLLGVQNRLDESEAGHREALATWERLFPMGHPEIARSLESIGRVVALQGRWSEADSLYSEALDRWSDRYGESHTHLATIRANQANIRYRMGEFEAAAAAYREGVRIWRANDERPLLGVGLRNLAVIEREIGAYASSDTLLAEALKLRRDLDGDVSASVAETHSAIAGLRREQGRYADAEESARTGLSTYEELGQPNHPNAQNTRLELGVALAAQRKFQEAQPLLEAVQEGFSGSLNPADIRLGRVGLWLGICLVESGDRTGGRELIEAALPVLETALRDGAPERVRAQSELARLGS